MENSNFNKPVIDLLSLLDEVEDMITERRAIEGPAFDDPVLPFPRSPASPPACPPSSPSPRT